jgi:hypothetical protein
MDQQLSAEHVTHQQVQHIQFRPAGMEATSNSKPVRTDYFTEPLRLTGQGVIGRPLVPAWSPDKAARRGYATDDPHTHTVNTYNAWFPWGKWK